MSKKLPVASSAILALSLAAGCSGSGGAPGGGAENAPPASGPQQTKRTYTMLVESHPSWPYTKDALAWKLIEEKTGVSLNVSTPAGLLDEAINLNVASGSMADITFFNSLVLANKIGMQGALVNVLDHRDAMPNFTRWLAQYPEVVKPYYSADGKMYMLPNEGFGETNRYIWMYRKDIFDQHNLTVPKTYDELHAVLKKLKEQYPDSFPLAFRTGAKLGLMRTLMPAFGSHDTFYYENGQVKYGPTEDSYKEAVTYLSRFYKEGLIPPDWLTMDVKLWQDILSTNKSFMTFDYIGRIDFFNVPLRKDNPQFNLAFMPPPAGPGGKAVNPHIHYVHSGMTVASNAKDIKGIMSYLDWFYAEETRTLMSWGVEGETYTVENGKKKIKSDFADVSDLRKRTNLSTNGTYTWLDYDAHLSLASPELQATYVEARKYDSTLRLPPAFTAKEQEIISTKGEAIDKHREENISKFILGTKSLAEWDTYVEGAEKLGLRDVMEVYKAAFERTK